MEAANLQALAAEVSCRDGWDLDVVLSRAGPRTVIVCNGRQLMAQIVVIMGFCFHFFARRLLL